MSGDGERSGSDRGPHSRAVVRNPVVMNPNPPQCHLFHSKKCLTRREKKKKITFNFLCDPIQVLFTCHSVHFQWGGNKSLKKKKANLLSNSMFSRNQVDRDNQKFSTNAPLAQVNYAEVVGEQT